MITIFNIIGIALFSSSISALTTMIMLDNNKPTILPPEIDSDMQIILENNGYVSLKEWKEKREKENANI